MKLSQLRPLRVYRTTGTDDRAVGGRGVSTRYLLHTGPEVEILRTNETIRNPKAVSSYLRPKRIVKRVRLYPVPDTGDTPWLTVGAEHVDLRGICIYDELCTLDEWPTMVSRYQVEKAAAVAARSAEGRTFDQVAAAVREIFPSTGAGLPPSTTATWVRVLMLVEAADALADAAEHGEVPAPTLYAYRRLRGARSDGDELWRP